MDWLINILISLAMGALIGWLAGLIMKSSNGLIMNIIIGILGSIVGGLIGKLLPLGGSWWIGLIFSIVGACLVIWILDLIKKK